LDSREDFYTILESYKAKFGKSEGVSENFGYYPLIFLGDRAYSGFNEEIKTAILAQITEAKK
jgi:hypothetical protein